MSHSTSDYPASDLPALAYCQPWEIADRLISLHLQYCSSFNLKADPDPIVDPDKMAANLRNTLTGETRKILSYLYEECGNHRLRRIITELVNRKAYGVLQERKWLWEEAMEFSQECRDYARECYAAQYRCAMAELPRSV